MTTKRKGYKWKPSTRRWVKDIKDKWITASSFWYPKKKRLKKSSDKEISMSLTALNKFLSKQSPNYRGLFYKQNPEISSRMAARGLIWSPERHRWIRKPDVATEAVLPQTRYAQQGFGSMGAPVKPEEPKSTPEGTKLTALEALGDKLSTWEKEFLSSVKDQFKKRGNLSDKQWAIVDKIEAKFKQQEDIESGAVEAQPLPPVLKKLDKLKKFMPEKHVQAIESMSNQVKAGGTLSPKQEDYLQIIEDNAKKQKKGLTEPATGNIIIRPNTNKYDLERWVSSSFHSLIEVSGKGAFHPQGRKWLEDNGFKWAGPMSGKMYLPIETEDKKAFIEEAKNQLGDPEGNPNYGEEFNEKVKELIQKRIDDVMDKMPDLREKGFSLKRPNPEAKGGYKDTPKVWKMLLGRK